MIETILFSFFGLSGVVALIWTVRKIKEWGRSEYEKDQAQEANEALSNRPHTLDDVIDRL